MYHHARQEYEVLVLNLQMKKPNPRGEVIRPNSHRKWQAEPHKVWPQILYLSYLKDNSTKRNVRPGISLSDAKPAWQVQGPEFNSQYKKKKKEKKALSLVFCII